MASAGNPRDKVTALIVNDEGIRVEITQFFDKTQVPQIAQKFVPDDIEIHRFIQFGPLQDGHSRGTTGGQATLGSGGVTGTVALSGDDATSVEQAEGSCTVQIPLFGKKIEALINANMEEIFQAEAAFTTDWCTAR